MNPALPPFTTWLGATAVAAGAVALVAQYNGKLAAMLAIVTLFAVLLRYPGAIGALIAAFNSSPIRND